MIEWRVGFITKRKSKLWLVFYGIAFGVALNGSFIIPIMVRNNLYFGVFMAVLTIVLIWLIVSQLRSDRRGFSRKIRLFLFGISLISFAFALFDLMIFVFGFHGIRVSLDYPYLWFGDISVVSFLASLLMGSLFGVIERFLALRENLDL